MRFITKFAIFAFLLIITGALFVSVCLSYGFARQSILVYTACKLESMGAKADLRLNNCSSDLFWFGYRYPSTRIESITIDSSSCKQPMMNYLAVLDMTDSNISTLSLNMPEIKDGTGLWDTLYVLWRVEHLDLSDSSIGDAVIRPLEGLKLDTRHRLKSLNLKGTRVTTEGIQKLKTLFPECDIFYDEASVSEKQTDESKNLFHSVHEDLAQ